MIIKIRKYFSHQLVCSLIAAEPGLEFIPQTNHLHSSPRTLIPPPNTSEAEHNQVYTLR